MSAENHFIQVKQGVEEFACYKNVIKSTNCHLNVTTQQLSGFSVIKFAEFRSSTDLSLKRSATSDGESTSSFKLPKYDDSASGSSEDTSPCVESPSSNKISVNDKSFPNPFTQFSHYAKWVATICEGQAAQSIVCENGKLFCCTCQRVNNCPENKAGVAKIKNLTRCDKGWTQVGISVSAFKSIREMKRRLWNKISRHLNCCSHKLSVQIVNNLAASESPPQSDSAAEQGKIQSMNMNTEVAVRLFQTVYFAVHELIPFNRHDKLMELIFSDIAASSKSSIETDRTAIALHIAQEMKKELCGHILTKNLDFSVILDESPITVNNKTCLCMYLRCNMNGRVRNLFFDLVQLDDFRAVTIYEAVFKAFRESGFSNDVLAKSWIALAIDGGKAIFVRLKMAANLFRNKFRRLQIVYFLAHRLEMMVGNVVKTSGTLRYLKKFLNELDAYFLFSQELQGLGIDLDIHLTELRKLLGACWTSNGYRSLTALMNYLPQIHKCLEAKCNKPRVNSLLSKLQDYNVLAEMCLLHDCLREISALSVYLQSDQSSAQTAWSVIESLATSLEYFKTGDGSTLASFHEEIKGNCDPRFLEIPISNFTATSETAFNVSRSKFLSALVSDFTNRLNTSEHLKCSMPLKKSSDCPKSLDPWFNDTIGLHLDGATADFGLDTGSTLQTLFDKLETLPTKTTECTQGFSAINILADDIRTCDSPMVSALLTMHINGPPLPEFNAATYVNSWNVEHHMN